MRKLAQFQAKNDVFQRTKFFKYVNLSISECLLFQPQLISVYVIDNLVCQIFLLRD